LAEAWIINASPVITLAKALLESGELAWLKQPRN